MALTLMMIRPNDREKTVDAAGTSSLYRNLNQKSGHIATIDGRCWTRTLMRHAATATATPTADEARNFHQKPKKICSPEKSL